MASGKTTIGKLLAESLRWKFYDTDQEIEREEGLSIREIFERKGEEYFRSKEMEVLKKLVKEEFCVISTGGGLGANEEAIKLMKERGLVVWLDIDFEEFLKRSQGDQERPLLKRSTEELRELYEKRKSVYSKAHLHLVANREPKDLVEEVIKTLSSP